MTILIAGEIGRLEAVSSISNTGDYVPIIQSDGALRKATTNNIGGVQAARCTAQVDFTSNTTLTNITGLSVNVLAAGVYAFRAYIVGTATANGGAKFAIGGTATATSISYTAAHNNNATTNARTTVTTLGSAAGAATAVFTAGMIEGTIVVNAAGTLTVQAAQNASHADTTSIYVNSNFIVTRIS